MSREGSRNASWRRSWGPPNNGLQTTLLRCTLRNAAEPERSVSFVVWTLAFVLFSCLAACSAHSWQTKEIEGGGSYRYRADSFDYDAFLRHVEKSDAANLESKADVIRIFAPAENRIYLFTEPAHPAHPAVFILEPDESGAVPLTGHCGGDVAACESWLVEVATVKSVLIEGLKQVPWNDP